MSPGSNQGRRILLPYSLGEIGGKINRWEPILRSTYWMRGRSMRPFGHLNHDHCREKCRQRLIHQMIWPGLLYCIHPEISCGALPTKKGCDIDVSAGPKHAMKGDVHILPDEQCRIIQSLFLSRTSKAKAASFFLFATPCYQRSWDRQLNSKGERQF